MAEVLLKATVALAAAKRAQIALQPKPGHVSTGGRSNQHLIDVIEAAEWAIAHALAEGTVALSFDELRLLEAHLQGL
jgi:hypothetical protein